MSGDLLGLVTSRQLIVCVGPGGVGKTTTAAAMALSAAQAGRKVALLTIDPARRLADALGLDGLDDTLRPVAVRGGGSLHAAMLDVQSSADALVQRVAPSPEVAARLLENRVYQAFAATLSRSHAYVAMERLFDILDRGGFDLVVLDTPPARNAIEILDAPGRLARFLDAQVIGRFLHPGAGVLQRWLPVGREAATRVLSAIVGRDFARDIVEFLGIFAELREGFVSRAGRIHTHLRAPSTAFALVSSARDTHLDDAAHIYESLKGRDVPLAAAIFNRSYTPELSAGDHPSPSARLAALWPQGEAPEGAAQALAALAHLRDSVIAEDGRALLAIRRFAEGLDPGCLVTRLPERRADIQDLGYLAQLIADARGISSKD